MSDLSENNLEQRDDELNKQMATHPAEESIQVLVKDANRRKRQLRLLTVTVILTLLAVIGLAVVSYKTVQLTKLAQSNRDAVVANCETANDSRQNNKQLWDFVFALPALEPPTPEESARAAQVKDFIAKTFAQRDCQAEINKQ